MRQIGNGLCDRLKFLIFDLVEQQCKNNCKQKAEYQIQERHRKGIAKAPPKFNIGKKKFELVEADKFRPLISSCRLKILEGHDPAGKWVIGKQKGICNTGQKHEIQCLVCLYLFNHESYFR